MKEDHKAPVRRNRVRRLAIGSILFLVGSGGNYWFWFVAWAIGEVGVHNPVRVFVEPLFFTAVLWFVAYLLLAILDAGSAFLLFAVALVTSLIIASVPVIGGNSFAATFISIHCAFLFPILGAAALILERGRFLPVLRYDRPRYRDWRFLTFVVLASSATLSVLTYFNHDTLKNEELRNSVTHFSGISGLRRVEAALASGADVNLQDRQGGGSILHFAAYRGNVELVRVLLDAGAEPNLRDANGVTPLFLAAGAGNSAAVVEQLIKEGADVHAQTKNGETPLHAAAGAPYSFKAAEGAFYPGIKRRGPTDQAYDIIKVLIAASSDIEARAEYDETPLHYAAKSGQESRTFIALLDAGADVDARNRFGETPLHRAAFFSNGPQLVSALLHAGADVNARDNRGQTPLHEAADGIGEDVVVIIEILLRFGADPAARDGKGRTALEIAENAASNTTAIEVLRAAIEKSR